MGEILKALNNYFYKFKEEGTFTIKNNTIVVKAPYLTGQYIRLQGSILNDGVHQVEEVREGIVITGLSDEEFTGVIYSLAIPKDLIEIAEKIKEFRNKEVKGHYSSETIPGGYSYTKATDKNGNIASWQYAFADELRGYKKMYSGERRVKSFDK